MIKKKLPAITNTPALPTNKKKRSVYADVNEELFFQADAEMQLRKLKIVDVVEWGLRAFIHKCNQPSAIAAKKRE